MLRHDPRLAAGDRTLPRSKHLLQQDIGLCGHGICESVCSFLRLSPHSLVLELVCPHEALHQHLRSATCVLQAPLQSTVKGVCCHVQPYALAHVPTISAAPAHARDQMRVPFSSIDAILGLAT